LHIAIVTYNKNNRQHHGCTSLKDNSREDNLETTAIAVK